MLGVIENHLTRQTAAIVVDAHQDLRLWAQPGLKERALGSLEGRRRKRKEKVPRDAESTGAYVPLIRHATNAVVADIQANKAGDQLAQ